MSLFTSKRERRYWLYTLIVVVAIYSTLGMAPHFTAILRHRGLLTPFFILGLILLLLAIVVHGLISKAGKTEIVVWIGISAVYLLTALRMVIAEERGHLFEYSIVALFILEALRERVKNGAQVPYPPLLAILLTIIIGSIDEGIQVFIPIRVFDPIDIAFNSFAAILAVGSSEALAWARSKVLKS